jgi:hypothetical protein
MSADAYLLGCPMVVVVDAVQVVVLIVPSKRAELHANVQPRHSHTIDVRPEPAQYRALPEWQVVQIPPAAHTVR